ncbi:MAG TPA: class I SAM-dependent methyltransferase [Dehalococcoidia bacterium]|jgi:ubiquinone/menaquinone biosynthesis C-methylase UbiE|nr:class I SAM-dependent methyltransferase [Dehalococcoidia bacterium]
MVQKKLGKRSVNGTISQHRISANAETDYWFSIYNRSDFLGDCYRQRLKQALSWVDAFQISQNAILLDAGCGVGISTQEMAKRGFHVIGLDFSDAMIKKAQSVCEAKLWRKIQFMQGDVERLPFADHSFEVVVCLGVITYLRSESTTLSEISRVLKPGGMLILSVVNKAHLAHYLDIPKFAHIRLLKTIGRKISHLNYSISNGSNTGVRSFLIPEMRKSLVRQRFIVLDYATIPLGLLTFSGRTIPPVELNAKVATLLGKTSGIPIIGSFGGMCIVKAVKG